MTERLYPLIPTPAVDAPEGHFEPEDDGGYDFPAPLAAQLHAARYGKRKLWETAIERQERTHSEDLSRRRDPAVALDALERIGTVLGRVADSAAPRSALPQDPEAEKAALLARLAELEAAEGASAAEGDGDEEAPAARPAAKRKPAASKAAPAE